MCLAKIGERVRHRVKKTDENLIENNLVAAELIHANVNAFVAVVLSSNGNRNPKLVYFR